MRLNCKKDLRKVIRGDWVGLGLFGEEIEFLRWWYKPNMHFWIVQGVAGIIFSNLSKTGARLFLCLWNR